MYVGRFAPSPSGDLHFGSLVTAVAAYLRAKNQGGKFILRIEDIDESRCSLAFAQSILKHLDMLNIKSDTRIVYQSLRTGIYQHYLDLLNSKGCTYRCTCTRQELKQRPCSCMKRRVSDDESYNICFDSRPFLEPHFDDLNLGRVNQCPSSEFNHIVLKRKDGLFAYNLCVVADDIEQGVSEIVRGRDLLNLTFVHKALYKALDVKAPAYLHIPLALNEFAVKYSKQNHAKPVLQDINPVQALKLALEFLNQDTFFISDKMSSAELVQRAAACFDSSKIGTENKILLY